MVISNFHSYFLSSALFFILSISLTHGLKSHTSLCSQTPYPGLCNSFVKTSDSENSIEKTPLEIHQTTLRVTMAEAERAYKLVSAMDSSSFDSRAKLAWTDCVDLYQDTLYLLNRSVDASHVDSQTWLSAASTNHQTCQNGYTDFNRTDHFQSFPFSITTFSMLLSNSLAVNKAMSSLSIKNLNDGSHRKLLSDGFPIWLSRSDRKLLQTPSTGGVSANLVVAQDGSGDYKTISEAVDASEKLSGGRRFVIHVKAGVYKENVVIKRAIKNLMLIGDGTGSTIITGNKNVQGGGSTTFRSATVGVSGDGFIAKGITFENTAGPQNHQAVAFRSGSDLSVLYECSFKGYQDTLYVYTQRQFYRNCDIYGTQDFIFGNAVVMFQNCNIYVRKPMSTQMNTITAQSRTDPNQNTGIIIHNSIVTAASDFKSPGGIKTYLGRPWQAYSRTVFMKTAIDGIVDKAGWLEWDGSFGLKTLYYGEYMNTGPGASTSGRVQWAGYHVMTSVAEATKFTVASFLGGGSWILATGVPCSAGL